MKSYLDGKMSTGFVQLFISKRLIQGAAAAMMGVFLPIFLYVTSGESFEFVIGFYFVASVGYFMLLAPASRLLNVFGYRKVLAVGMFFNFLLYAILFFTNESNIYMLVVPMLIAVILFRLLHWVPYLVDFTLFTDPKNRSREVSLAFATIAFMGVIGPILAGYIISTSSYQTLFGIVVVLVAIAGVSYLFVPETKEKFSWGYLETWREFCSKERRGMIISLAANGAEATFTVIVWPIFIYLLLDGNVLEVGAVSTFIVGITIALQLAFGKFIDTKKTKQSAALKYGTVFDAIGWVAKIFVFTTTQVFLVGLYHNITKIFTKTSYTTLLHDTAADQGHYVDEFTVIREMAIHIGRAFALIIIGFVAIYLPIQWTFVIGAVAVLMLNAAYYHVSHK